MYTILLRLLITAGALMLVAHLLPGITVANFYHALLTALILGVLNISLKPILVLLTLPATLLTFGLFIFVINACIFLVADFFLTGFSVDGFVPAFVGSLCVSVISTALYKLLA